MNHRASFNRAGIVSMAIALMSVPVMVSSCRAQDAEQASVTKADKVMMHAEPKVGDTAPDFTLESLDGKKVTLSDVAKKGNVVLVMLRGYPGYQCPFCTAQVADLVGKTTEFAQAKATVLLVYPGEGATVKQRAGEFVANKSLPDVFTMLLDPDFSFTNQYDLRWKKQGETAYPSTFILDSNRKIVFAKVSHGHGGRATADEILAALPKP